ncbi:hypothetical protein ACE1CI_01485 [Aerosakkonemataceae cyanobacterium BLCC-F50]|uniref:Uncharacterized protein n=1 Tax=Floridaenema flaviceps BLCC-F50 TaxID=3153642 RepID=A0ABV4XIQ1_9CYAN
MMQYTTVHFLRDSQAENGEYIENFCSSPNKNLTVVATGSLHPSVLNENNFAINIMKNLCNDKIEFEFIENIYYRWLEELQPLEFTKIDQEAKDCFNYIGLKLHSDGKGKEKTWEAIVTGNLCLVKINRYSSKFELYQFQTYEKKDDYTNYFEIPVYFTGNYNYDDIFLLLNQELIPEFLAWIDREYQAWENFLLIQSNEEFNIVAKQLIQNEIIINNQTLIVLIKISFNQVELNKENIDKTQLNTNLFPKCNDLMQVRNKKMILILIGICSIYISLFYLASFPLQRPQSNPIRIEQKNNSP